MDFYNFCTVVSRKKYFIHIWQKYPPHLINVLTLPSENENIKFHTFIMHSMNITCCIKHDVKHKVHQVQRKQTDSHKVCLKFPPLARTQARKRVCHWSTLSISDCSKPRHRCSRCCRSSSMSCTLVSYTRCWMTDHSARHVATELIRPQSGGLCHLFRSNKGRGLVSTEGWDSLVGP